MGLLLSEWKEINFSTDFSQLGATRDHLGAIGAPWAFMGHKIYYCRPDRLGLWETLHNKVCRTDIPARPVVTLSVRTLYYSHKICGNTYHIKLSKLWPKTALCGDTCCICVCGMAQLQRVEA